MYAYATEVHNRLCRHKLKGLKKSLLLRSVQCSIFFFSHLLPFLGSFVGSSSKMFFFGLMEKEINTNPLKVFEIALTSGSGRRMSASGWFQR